MEARTYEHVLQLSRTVFNLPNHWMLVEHDHITIAEQRMGWKTSLGGLYTAQGLRRFPRAYQTGSLKKS